MRRLTTRQLVLIALAAIVVTWTVAANFVPTQVRVVGVDVDTRLGWALAVAFVLGIATGAVIARRR